MEEILENAYIYCFELDNKPIYIGKTHQKVEDRLEQHLVNCHNKKLKEYLLSENPPQFKILYESHNMITEEILSSIEESYINTLKPECNVLGITKPYNLFEPKQALNTAEVLNKKCSYTLQDLIVLFNNNPQIKDVCLFDISSKCSTRREKECMSEALEQYYGKLNEFNRRDYYNKDSGCFQQKVWAVKENESGEIRFLTDEEKLHGVSEKDGKAVLVRALFRYYTDEEYKDKSDYLRRWYINNQDHLSLYFPLGYIQLNSCEDSIVYKQPLQEAYYDYFDNK